MSSIPNRAPNVITASGTVTVADGVVNSINAAGALTLTLPLPTVDGIRVPFIDETGHAHVIQCSGSPASGLNAASGTLTFGGTAGDSCELISRNDRWYTLSLNGVTVS